MTMTNECIVEGAEEAIFLFFSFRYFCIHSPIKYCMDQINHLLEAELEYNGGEVQAHIAASFFYAWSIHSLT